MCVRIPPTTQGLVGSRMLLVQDEREKSWLSNQPLNRERYMIFFSSLTAFFHRLESRILPWQQSDVPASHDDCVALMEDIDPILRFTRKTLGVVLLVFMLWVSLAPLDSAAVAPGVVVVLSNRKTIQHLEGGIISALFVKEGDVVVENQPLLALNDTSARARHQLLQGQWNGAKAVESRLFAERDSASDISFESELLQHTDNPEIQKILEGQRTLFHARNTALNGQRDVLSQRALQFEKQIEGLRSQITSAESQLQSLRDEELAVHHLFEEGLALKPRLLQIQREIADLTGRHADYRAQIARAEEAIIETNYQMASLHKDRLKEVEQELKDTQAQLHDLQEQLQASKDVMERTVITAPQAGVVMGLKQHTIGGVVTPGAAILDVVPHDDLLVVEAQIAPQDIDVVRVGLSAKIAFSAYKSRLVPRVEGRVTQVSADRFTDERTGASYYRAQIEVSEAALTKLNFPITLTPGMPAETFIITGSRTLLHYLLSPLLESFHRAFKEE